MEHPQSLRETPPPSPVCSMCERLYFIESAYVDGMCRTCGFVAHCE